MNPHAEEWDWPAERPPTRQRRRYYHRIEYQPSGWNSPVTRKIVDVYWRTTVVIIKMLISIPLALMAIGAFYLLWIIVGLVV
jgi:hypothetical protein